jgi:hypothetical protein
MFVAKYIDYLWQTDLHEIHARDEATGGTPTIYVLAFLDDDSHFIMNYRLIHDKRSDNCAAVLAEAFEMWSLHSESNRECRSRIFSPSIRPFPPLELLDCE